MRELTPREGDVAKRLLLGESNKLIAKRLEISPFTVRDLVSQLCAKLRQPNRTGVAVFLASEFGAALLAGHPSEPKPCMARVVTKVAVAKEVPVWSNFAFAPAVATSHEPRATSHEPRATSHQRPATSHQPRAKFLAPWRLAVRVRLLPTASICHRARRKRPSLPAN